MDLHNVSSHRLYFVFCFFLVALFFVLRVALRLFGFHYKCSVKADSWLLSCFTAVCISSFGVWALLFLRNAGGFNAPSLLAVLSSQPEASRVAATFFVAHCSVDLLLGLLFYPSQLDLLSGYVHHLVYAISLTYSGLYLGNHFVFALFGLDEIPTLILGLGNVHTPWRLDLSFGVTWLVLRIVFHSYITFLLGIVSVSLPWRSALSITLGATLSLLLHLHWFANWTRGYLKRRRAKAA